jgi:hypothetical protein
MLDAMIDPFYGSFAEVPLRILLDIDDTSRSNSGTGQQAEDSTLPPAIPCSCRR